MTEAKRKLVLIYTRDFSQWLHEFLYRQIAEVSPYHLVSVWGRGLEDQIVHFTGRADEIFRYEDDYIALREYMIHKDLESDIFREEVHEQFRANVDKMRELMKTPARDIVDPYSFFKEIIDLGNKMYPYYTMSVFIPGQWRDEFVKVHGNKGNKVLDILYKSREHSEGVYKILNDFFREWVGGLLEKSGHKREYFKVLTITEIENFLRDGAMPDLNELEKRAKGYVYIDNKIIPTENFDAFLQVRNLYIEKPDNIGQIKELKGTVACRGEIVRGKVFTIFNSAEVKNFKAGSILVTPMTSPEYVPAMKKALAIVTDEGGLTCHAAIVSRELGIPCIIGTKIATEVLKDGDSVEVDANKGIIKLLN